MTIALISASTAPLFSSPQTEYKGVFTNDSTALISSTVASGGALNATTLTVAADPGFTYRFAVSIAGGGNAGGTIPLECLMSYSTAPASNVLTLAAKIKQTAGLTVGASVQQMLKLGTPFQARHIRLLNQTDGISWEWFDGMGTSTAIKNVWATGVTTLEAYGGPIVISDGIWLPQTLMGVNKTFAFNITS